MHRSWLEILLKIKGFARGAFKNFSRPNNISSFLLTVRGYTMTSPWKYGSWLTEARFSLLTKEQLAEESDKLISGLKEKLQTLEAQQKNEKITSGIILVKL
jgi:hypothetical protein